jgi:hypothetical protein
MREDMRSVHATNDVDRAQTMADLRERLARMKNAVNGANVAAMEIDDDDDDDN